MRPKARNTTRNPALPRPARWRAAKSREAAVVPALNGFETGEPAHPIRDAVLQRLGRRRADRSQTAPPATDRGSGDRSRSAAGAATAGAAPAGPGYRDRASAGSAPRSATEASSAAGGKPEATGRTAVLQGVRRLPSRLARPITGRVSAIRRESDIRSAPDAKGASWIRRFPSPVPRSKRSGGPAKRESEGFDRAPRIGAAEEPRLRGEADRAPRTEGGADAARRREGFDRAPNAEGGAHRQRRGGRFDRGARDAEKPRGRSRMRLGRKSPAARPADWIPVRYRVARAVGAAASALPESRAVRVGTAVAELVAANQGVIKAGLTAASAVPVLRPYVKVAATAMGAIAVARRIARAKNAASDVAAAFRGPTTPGMAHAGNGFGLDAKALPSQSTGGGESASAGTGAAPVVPAQGNLGGSESPQADEDRGAVRPAAASAGGVRGAGGEGEGTGRAGSAPGDRALRTNGRDAEEAGPSAALQSERHRDAGETRASRAAGAETSTEQGREP